MVARKAPEPDVIEAITKAIQQGYREGYAAAEKAFADAATAGRQVNDVAIATLGGQRDALAAAYKRIGEMEEANKQLLKLLDGLGASYAQKELIDAQERIEKDRTEKEASWKHALIEKLGPAGPRLLEMAMGRLGMPAPAGDDAEDRRALVRAIPKLLNDVELTSRIQTVVGDDDWQRILAYLGRLTVGGQAQAPMNGTAPN